MARVIDMADPARGEDAIEFQGLHHDAGVSFIVIDAPPGSGPRLHPHPYEEVFVVMEGSVTFTAGDEVIEASGGQVVMVGAGVAHWRCAQVRELRRWRAPADRHTRERFITEWLED